jgi:ABC-type glycerol-3-phosphate transport system substrate-binding protein
MRSGGTSIFNETLTASAVNRDQNFSKVLATLLKWTYVDHLIPTPAELASLTQANSGYMNPQWQEFAQNHFGLLSGSRFLLMPLRELKCTNELDAILPPNWGYPTCISSTRYLTVYRGSEKNESTALFAAYLRSDAYNQLIIDGGDNLPPIPKFMDSASYMNPPTHPNEAKLNQNIKKIAMNYALGREDSPFVLYMNITKYINYAYESVVSRIATPEAAVKELDKSINKEIAAYVKRHPEKQADYESALSTQKRIDATLSNGQKLDLKDVRNLFLKKYYQDTGRAQ